MIVVTVMNETAIGEGPSFVSVNGVAVLVLPICTLENGKPPAPVEKMATSSSTPVPDRLTPSSKAAPLLSVLWIVSVADVGPIALGVKSTEMRQLSPGLIAEPEEQGVPTAGGGPNANPEPAGIFSAPKVIVAVALVLVTVTFCAVLVAFKSTSPNASVAGEIDGSPFVKT